MKPRTIIKLVTAMSLVLLFLAPSFAGAVEQNKLDLEAPSWSVRHAIPTDAHQFIIQFKLKNTHQFGVHKIQWACYNSCENRQDRCVKQCETTFSDDTILGPQGISRAYCISECNLAYEFCNQRCEEKR